jgi:hypothetical protein
MKSGHRRMVMPILISSQFLLDSVFTSLTHGLHIAASAFDGIAGSHRHHDASRDNGNDYFLHLRVSGS